MKLTSVPKAEERAHFRALSLGAAVLAAVGSLQGSLGEDVQGGVTSWGLSLEI